MCTFVYLFVVYFSFAPVILASIHCYGNYSDIQVLMMINETETLTSTLHHNIFTYLDYVFLLPSSVTIYSEHGIIPVLVSGISRQSHYSLSVLLYLSCNKTHFLLSTSVLAIPFHSSKTLSDCIPFRDTTQNIDSLFRPICFSFILYKFSIYFQFSILLLRILLWSFFLFLTLPFLLYFPQIFILSCLGTTNVFRHTLRGIAFYKVFQYTEDPCDC